eukprot:3784-Heterococcus_DN1.PRE.3
MYSAKRVEHWIALSAVTHVCSYQQRTQCSAVALMLLFYTAAYWTYALAGWDPLNLRPNDPETWEKVQTRELKNGRLAMLAIAAFLVQENLTGQGPIEQLVAGHISPFGT